MNKLLNSVTGRIRYYLIAVMDWASLISIVIFLGIGSTHLICLIMFKHIIWHISCICGSLAMIYYWFYVQDSWSKYGGCPIVILNEVGFKRFFRAAKLKYRNNFWEAMLVYLPFFPLILFYVLFSFGVIL
jgi:hypothetical protein